MNRDQKSGALIIIAAIALMAVALLLSDGWGVSGLSLYLTTIEIEGKYGELEHFFIVKTGYVLALLALVLAYGVARYLSLLPPIFRK